MKVIHKAESRGFSDYGWLKTFRSFSFDDYYDPEKVSFGKLRVLNDDTVESGQGFAEHPHQNMEIISIPLSGSLEHSDNVGNHGIIHTGDVQIMSAGTGIYHSEFNASKSQQVNFLQIWIFPNVKNVTPRYEQKSFDAEGRKNRIQSIVSPNSSPETLTLYQDAFIARVELDDGSEVTYKFNKNNNGLYCFLIQGEINVDNESLKKRDALEISDVESISIQVVSKADILLLEVPMK